jgi:predicted phosphate transport protein (TIGR00153 family)
MFKINEMFGQSPFGPIHEHMLKVKDCVDKLPELKETFLNNEHVRLYEVFEEVCKLEHKADVVKQEIREHLPKTYFLPVGRGDILQFLNSQDAIADAIEDVAVMITMRETTVPESLKETFGILFDRVYDTCDFAFEVSGEIKKLVETGFGGYEASKVSELIIKTEESEWKADKAQMTLSKLLFKDEKSIDAVSILILDKIIVRLGKVANNAEASADMMRNLLAKK